jgi:hypothetical protein
MSTIHPSYDPATRTWFVEDPPIEAPTVRELLIKLGHKNRSKWTIQDYFPAGASVRPGMAIVEAAPSPVVVHPVGPAKTKTTGWDWRPSPRKEPAPVPVPAVVKPPRVRGPIVRKWETHHKLTICDQETYEQALDMWAAGVKGNVIAEKLGLTRMQVCSRMVPNARAHGDPRAVVRASHYGRKRSLHGDQSKNADLPVLRDGLGD